MNNYNLSIPEEKVKEAFFYRTERFHVIACYIGIVLNLLWVASDYFVFPLKLQSFFLFRFAVSVSSFLLLVLRKKFRYTVYFCMFFLVLGISIQNAYMWSFMDLEHVHQHTFAYIALFLGAGMLVLWEFYYSILLLIFSLLANIIFYCLHSTLEFSAFLINGGFLTFTVAIFAAFLIRSRYRLTYSEIKGRLEIEKSKSIIESEHQLVIHQKKEIQEKNEEILSSIRYAKRIQSAILPSVSQMNEIFSDYFVLYQPKDIVSGDFYWVEKIKIKSDSLLEKTLHLCAVADCTGHGVPGAFMSLIGNNSLRQSSKNSAVTSASQVLDYLNENVKHSLSSSTDDMPIRDGMDIALVAIDFVNNQLQFAGANNPLYLIRNGELQLIKGDKQAIGTETQQNYSGHTLSLQRGDMIYLFSDGYADQFGGEEGKKFKYKNLQQLLLSISTNSCSEQKQKLWTRFEEWRGDKEQTDDVCIIGIRVP